MKKIAMRSLAAERRANNRGRKGGEEEKRERERERNGEKEKKKTGPCMAAHLHRGSAYDFAIY
jgi:hypothetical protein